MKRRLINFLKRIDKLFFYKKHLSRIGVKYGNNCLFNKNTDFGSEPYLITIGNNFYSSNNITFITHDGSIHVLRNKYPELKNADIISPIIIGNNVFLGHSVTVLLGSTIGDNVIIGAGSIVKGILDSNSVYAGIPAKKICSIYDFKSKHENKIFHTKNLTQKEKEKFLKKIFHTKEN